MLLAEMNERDPPKRTRVRKKATVKRSLPATMVAKSIFDQLQDLSERSGVPVTAVIEETLRKGLGLVSPQMLEAQKIILAAAAKLKKVR